MTNPLTELETALAHLRLSPEPCDEHLEELRQQYETVLTLLESHFLGALLSGNWNEFEEFVNDFRVTQDVEVDQTKDPLKELWAIAFPKELSSMIDLLLIAALAQAPPPPEPTPPGGDRRDKASTDSLIRSGADSRPSPNPNQQLEKD